LYGYPDVRALQFTRRVFDKVAQISEPNLSEKLWMPEQRDSSEFFELFTPETRSF